MKKYSLFQNKRISDYTVRRLSMYLRTLNFLEQSGVETVSSEEIAKIEGFTSAQVRKDLSYFGSFGRRGLGYNVTALRKRISIILGLNRKWNISLIGAVPLNGIGGALLNYEEFKKKRLTITKIFDKDPKIVGTKIKGITVRHIDELERKIDPRKEPIAILTVPPQDVQSIINRLDKIGVKGVLYFASRTISIPKKMIVRNEDTVMELEALTYHIANKTKRQLKTLK